MTSVVHVVEATFAGIGRHVLDLAEAQHQRGWDVTVVWSPTRSSDTFRERLETLSAQAGIGARSVVMSRHPSPANLRAVHHVHALLEQLDTDVVHGHGSGGGQVARLAAIRRPAVAVYTPNAYRSMQTNGSKLIGVLAGLAERALVPLGDATINVSSEEASFAFARRLIGGHSAVIENGVDALVGPPTVPSNVDAFVSAGEGPVVGFVGRLSEQKRPHAAVEAVAAHNRRFDEQLRLCVIGDGVDHERVASLIAHSGVDAITLASDRGADAMGLFDVLIVPSGYEGFPYVVLEALRAGTPVVVSPAVPVDAFGPQPAGVVVSRGWGANDDAEALRQALNTEWSEASIRSTAAPFTVERMTSKTVDLYRSVLDAR